MYIICMSVDSLYSPIYVQGMYICTYLGGRMFVATNYYVRPYVYTHLESDNASKYFCGIVLF